MTKNQNPTATEPQDEPQDVDTNATPSTPSPTDSTPPPSKPSTDADPANDGNPDADPNPNREAAKYRRQLRDVEAERDALAGQLTELRRQVLQDKLTGSRVTMKGLEATHGDINTLFGKEGQLLDAQLNGALRQAEKELIHDPYRGVVPNQGGHKDFDVDGTGDWSRALGRPGSF